MVNEDFITELTSSIIDTVTSEYRRLRIPSGKRIPELKGKIAEILSRELISVLYPIRPHEYVYDGMGPIECTFTELTGEKCGISRANHPKEYVSVVAVNNSDPDYICAYGLFTSARSANEYINQKVDRLRFTYHALPLRDIRTSELIDDMKTLSEIQTITYCEPCGINHEAPACNAGM